MYLFFSPLLELARKAKLTQYAIAWLQLFARKNRHSSEQPASGKRGFALRNLLLPSKVAGGRGHTDAPSMRKVFTLEFLHVGLQWPAFRLLPCVCAFRGNFGPFLTVLSLLFQSSWKCEVVRIHFARQRFFILLQKRPTLEGQIKSFLSLFNGIWMNRVKYALCIHW